ncbi:MAG: ABC transporter ATP-binding protein [Nitrospinae bacterium]|nr:ABC transporter ATP-binding protein [Nitrospinota bacterium]
MLELRGVSTAYGLLEAVKGVDITIRNGEIACLIGANGAGKSTTLLTIAGILRPLRGSISFQGRRIDGLSADDIVQQGVSLVPEGRRIFPELTVAENLALGAYTRRDRKAVAEDFEWVIDLFPILAERRAQKGGTLSGGEQQMLAIGRALMARPRLLLLDEPSLGLAPLIVEQIFEILAEINRNGTTLFLVEQNAHIALTMAHTGYVMETGRIVMHDAADRLIRHPQVRSAYLGE